MEATRAYRYRIYPTLSQQEWLNHQFGACRWVYNHFLRTRIDFYTTHKDDPIKKGLTYLDTARMLTEIKKQPETVWLSESNAQSLQRTLADLDVAYNRFFRKASQFPRFKKKGQHDSFRVPQGFKVKLDSGNITLPKIGPIKTVFHRPPEGTIKHITVSQTSSGRYFVSLCSEVEIPTPVPQGSGEIGIDLGLKDFIVTSDGEHVPAPKHLRKAEKKLKRAQRRVSRRVKGSTGRERAKRILARQHEKVRDRRQDFIHKLTHRLVHENQVIHVESLNIKGMVKNHSLAKSISDAAWGEFLRQSKYKGEWYGCRIGEIDRFFPSSKRCSTTGCGWINEGLRLRDRSWTCPACGTVHDRDENAAVNIRDFGTVGVTGTIPDRKIGENAGGVSDTGTLKPETDLFPSR